MGFELKAIVVVVLLSFAVGIFAYPQLPEKAASHWNIAGEVDGYLPAVWAAFLMPLISAVIAVLFFFIPTIDPLRANVETFKKEYHQFCLVILVFLFIVYVQNILWNLGTHISFNETMPILFFVLLFYLGAFLEKTKQNWFIGIRTPWTISSPEVWDKTHKLGGKLFKAAGCLSLLWLIFPTYGFWIVFAMMIAAASVPMVYSYFLFVRLQKTEKIEGFKKSKGNTKRD